MLLKSKSAAQSVNHVYLRNQGCIFAAANTLPAGWPAGWGGAAPWRVGMHVGTTESEGTCAAVFSSRFRFFAALSSALASSRLALSDSFAALTAFRAVLRHLHRTHQQGLDE
jgi:hypothetical protein